MGSQAKKKNNQRVTYNISLDDLEVKKSMPPGVCQPQCGEMISKGAFINYSQIWPPLAANFLALWVWEVVETGAIPIDTYSE